MSDIALADLGLRDAATATEHAYQRAMGCNDPQHLRQVVADLSGRVFALLDLLIQDRAELQRLRDADKAGLGAPVPARLTTEVAARVLYQALPEIGAEPGVGDDDEDGWS